MSFNCALQLFISAETRGKPSVPSASAAGAVADGPTASAATEEPSAEEEAELYKEAEPLTTDDIAEAVAVPSNLPLDYTPETVPPAVLMPLDHVLNLQSWRLASALLSQDRVVCAGEEWRGWC